MFVADVALGILFTVLGVRNRAAWVIPLVVLGIALAGLALSRVWAGTDEINGELSPDQVEAWRKKGLVMMAVGSIPIYVAVFGVAASMPRG